MSDINTIINEVFEEENYDIFDEFSETDIKELVNKLIAARDAVVINAKLGDYIIKVSNKRKSYVSVSGVDGTGVAHSEYYIFHEDKDLYDCIKDLLDMLNEAWYYLTRE